MRKTLFAIIASTIIGCNLAPFDQKNYQWVDKKESRPATYGDYVSNSGVRKKYDAKNDSVWTYYITGGIWNLDTVALKVQSIYDSVHINNAASSQSDTGYAGRLNGNILDGLIPDDNIEVHTSDTTGTRLFLIEGNAGWKATDTANITVYVRMNDVEYDHMILGKTAVNPSSNTSNNTSGKSSVKEYKIRILPRNQQ